MKTSIVGWFLFFSTSVLGQDIATVRNWIKEGNIDPVYSSLENLIQKASTHEDSAAIALEYFYLCNKYTEANDHEFAINTMRRARVIYKALGKIIYVYYTMLYESNLCWHNSRLSEAVEQLNEAMDFAAQNNIKEKDPLAYHTIFSELSSVNYYLGDYQKALFYADKGLEYFLVNRTYKRFPPALFLGKGMCQMRMQNFDEAEKNFRLAWDLSDSIPELALKEDRQSAILTNFAELNYLKKNLVKAIEFQKKATESRTVQKSELDFTYYELGFYQLKANQLENAKRSFEISLTLKRRPWNALCGLARLKAIDNDLVGADSLYQEALAAIEQRARYVTGSSVAAFFESVAHVYKYAVLFYVRAGRPDRALEVVEKAKARYMSRLVSLADLRGDAGIFQDSLKIIEKKINRFYETNPDSVAVNVELYALEIEREKLLEKIHLQNPNYFQFRSTNEISTDSLQRALGETYQLVEYVVSDDSIAALVITNQSTQGVIWAFQKDSLTAMIKNAVTDNNIAIHDLNRLYRMIFQPIEPYLSKEKTLVIVLDGVLYQLPFEMLVTKSGRSYSDSRYILHDYPIVYSVSTRLFIDRLRRESKAPLNYAGFAVTTFTDLPSLKFVREQVKNAASIFGRSDYFEDDASTKDKLAVQGSEYKILELATHALVSDAEPLYSKIALWDAVDSIRSDEWLYVHEVYNLKLDADLVSLSGCRTGLGTLTSGEGFIGFNQAFSFAGAASLLMSFWPAEDEATSSVLNVFYNDLNKGFSRAEALRHAKLQYLETAHELKRSPHYWASFTLWGNPKPIRFNPSLMWLWIGFGCGFAVTLGIMIRLKRHSKPSGR